jgi:cytochrome c oxidase cbb3-type subunit 3
MYKNVLQSIDNIAIWPVISFVIFFLFFICLLWWVFTSKKAYIDTMSKLPLEENKPGDKKDKGPGPVKSALATLTLMFVSMGAFAQEPATRSFWADPLKDPMLPLYLITTLVFIVILLVMAVAITMIRVLNMFIREAARERAAKLGVPYAPEPSAWNKFWQRMNASVPVQQEADIDMGHSYDGIRELDNHLPPWWKWLFYATIGWAAVYIVVFHLSDTLPLSIEEYQQEVAAAEEQIQRLKATQPQATIDEAALQFTQDAAIIDAGKKLFTDFNCGSCHRADGGGNSIGPNLTDVYWLHGGDIKQVYVSIKDGYVDKGMPAWGKNMSPSQVRDIAFFVMSLQGSNPANAKAPQGEIFKPEAVEVKTDSTVAKL